jgi:DNA polymerase III sliding clamp (beta) subunit (PCNA family)
VLTAVVTNGQLLARVETTTLSQEKGNIQQIVSRKTVVEILRLVKGEGVVKLRVTRQYQGKCN